MLECIVAQIIIGYNVLTKETRILYRCEGEKAFKYLKPPRESMSKVKGIYSIDCNCIILEERFGL